MLLLLPIIFEEFSVVISSSDFFAPFFSPLFTGFHRLLILTPKICLPMFVFPIFFFLFQLDIFNLYILKFSDAFFFPSSNSM